jgi:hypothetical protein
VAEPKCQPDADGCELHLQQLWVRMTRAELMRHALSAAALLNRKKPRIMVSRHLSVSALV